jgi:hypothetical protein
VGAQQCGDGLVCGSWRLLDEGRGQLLGGGLRSSRSTTTQRGCGGPSDHTERLTRTGAGRERGLLEPVLRIRQQRRQLGGEVRIFQHLIRAVHPRRSLRRVIFVCATVGVLSADSIPSASQAAVKPAELTPFQSLVVVCLMLAQALQGFAEPAFVSMIAGSSGAKSAIVASPTLR